MSTGKTAYRGIVIFKVFQINLKWKRTKAQKSEVKEKTFQDFLFKRQHQLEKDQPLNQKVN